ncbi:MAG: dTMP kinase [Bdellovibrionaceae bacterium]|nr:dTMP kinase [Pseudobdellovibrionaceae bacterium]
MPFLVFEGLDGSGKSSLMSALEGELQSKGQRTLRTREPGGTPLGDEIRELILRTQGAAPTARTELLLYEASRAQHCDLVIRPALERNQWVLCDRFTASSIAFQAGGREIPLTWVERLNEFATSGLKPDVTVLLDLSVEESRRRRNHRNNETGSQQDRIESETDVFHEKVRHGFLKQAEQDPKSWIVLDAAKSPAQLLQELLSKLKGFKWDAF